MKENYALESTLMTVEAVTRNSSNSLWTLVLEGGRRSEVSEQTAQRFMPFVGTSITAGKARELMKEGEADAWRQS